jgi:hypothetical protein
MSGPAGFVELDPALPPMRLGSSCSTCRWVVPRINIGVEQGDVTVGGLPPDLEVVRPAT